jgi:hypothetical protein
MSFSPSLRPFASCKQPRLCSHLRVLSAPTLAAAALSSAAECSRCRKLCCSNQEMTAMLRTQEPQSSGLCRCSRTAELKTSAHRGWHCSQSSMPRSQAASAAQMVCGLRQGQPCSLNCHLHSCLLCSCECSCCCCCCSCWCYWCYWCCWCCWSSSSDRPCGGHLAAVAAVALRTACSLGKINKSVLQQ